MKSITSSYYVFLICFGIIVETCLSLNYCEVEKKVCKTKMSHVACDHKSVISVSVKIK